MSLLPIRCNECDYMYRLGYWKGHSDATKWVVKSLSNALDGKPVVVPKESQWVDTPVQTSKEEKEEQGKK